MGMAHEKMALFYRKSLFWLLFLAPEKKVNFALNYEKRICNYSLRISSKLPNCRIIFINHSLLFKDNLFGNYALKVENSWQFQVIKTNYLLLL